MDQPVGVPPTLRRRIDENQPRPEDVQLSLSLSQNQYVGTASDRQGEARRYTGWNYVGIYRDMPGVVHLGHTVDVPYVRVTPKPGGPVVEMLVACKEGLLTKEEAIGKEWIPNQAEIREHAARIRAGHETNGIVRRADYVGFDLGRGGMGVPGVGASAFGFGQDADVFV
jgi:hypothetical protein